MVDWFEVRLSAGDAGAGACRTRKRTRLPWVYPVSREYQKELKRTQLSLIREDGVTEFSDQALELNTGEWTADESGIWRYGVSGPIYACTHPIMPVQRMTKRGHGIGQNKVGVPAQLFQ